MELLWDAVEPMTAADVRDALRDREPAITTVLTVLSRLESKDLVERERDSRPHRYRAMTSRADHVAELMHEVLGSAADTEAVLAKFVGSASDEETNTLRKLLRKIRR
jgi:predicted transcriptional regulator